MIRTLCAVVVMVCTMQLQLYAQTPAAAQSGSITAGRQQLMKTAPLLQHAVMDSLNARTTALHAVLAPDKKGAFPSLNEATRLDFYTHVKQVYGEKQLQGVKKGYELFNDKSRINRYFDEKLRGFYALKGNSNIRGLMKAGAYDNTFRGATAAITTDNAPGALMPVAFTLHAEDNVVVGNIPVNIVYSNISGRSAFDENQLYGGLGKLSFDKEAYLERMSGYVNKSFDLNKYFLQDINVAASFKSFAEKKMDGLREEMKQLPAGYSSALDNLVSADQLIYLDSSQIKQLLLHNTSLNIDEKQLSSQAPDSLLSPQTAAARTYLSKVLRLKAALGEGMAAQQTMSAQKMVNENIGGNLGSMAGKQQQIKALAPMGFLQKLLLSAKSLQIGKIAGGDGSAMAKNLFMSGAQGSFLNNDKFLMLGLGNRNDALDIKNMGLNSGVDPASFSMQFLQMGKGDVSTAHSHAGIVNASTRNKGEFNSQLLSRNIFVGAFSERIDLGEYGTIAAEIAKSNTEFRNSATGNDFALASKTAAFTLMNDFWQTLSVGLDYSGSIKTLDLTQRVYINYSGLGYSNPAAPGSSRGTVRYGVNLRRSWNKRKVTIGFRADMQDIRMSAITDSRWKNRQFAVDARVKVKKNLTLSSRLSQATMKGISQKYDQPGYLSRQLSISSQYSGKIGGLPQTNNTTLGIQQMELYPSRSLLVNLNTNQSFIIGTHVLTVSVLYNKDVKDQALYGNLLTAETGWSYMLLKRIACTSGLTYLRNKGVVEQAGIRQTMGAELLPRLNMNVYVDCRKHLVNTAQNYLFGNFSTQLSLHYLLN
ncbi:hypothetical protein ECE50_014820 [Chitinophaga sp. Mgbs1]|uniref:Outer membrane protein beta-barrel domain-containing protein n=1 Tax=Chitinophaga solisilvae TaxID=1233460 RepID=A0A9Q5GW34_9BACT|nr:hypothetical protein [Chitinophaga solisilvae]